jgi:hypothetical protein
MEAVSIDAMAMAVVLDLLLSLPLPGLTPDLSPLLLGAFTPPLRSLYKATLSFERSNRKGMALPADI